MFSLSRVLKQNHFTLTIPQRYRGAREGPPSGLQNAPRTFAFPAGHWHRAAETDWRVSHYSLRVPDKMPIGLRPPCLPGSTEFIRITENSSTLFYIISASISATCLTGVREAGGKGNVLRRGGREERGTASTALLPWLVTRLARNSIGL